MALPYYTMRDCKRVVDSARRLFGQVTKREKVLIEHFCSHERMVRSEGGPDDRFLGFSVIRSKARVGRFE
jgi:hypothetical protein